MTTYFIVGALKAHAFWLLYVWLGSAWLASEISNRKGYGEKWGLGTGLLLSAIGVLVWLIVPARPDSIWKERGLRRATGPKSPKPTDVG